MTLDRKYLSFAMFYVIAGMCLGVYMGASQNHTQHVTHAHILLVGFVVSFIYGIIHKLWLTRPNPLLANIQLILHQVAAAIMFVALALLFSGHFEAEKIEPILGMSSVGVLLGAILMLVLVVQSRHHRSA